jgi:diadenosine tetraphosphatase ApaH/serine/threonine PP2A family protein phosphatase
VSTLFVGDVHGCAVELAELVQKAGPTRVVLVGDLFTKGPAPEDVWKQVRDDGFESVLGNHDDRLLQVIDGTRKDDKKGRKTVERLDAEDPGWLAWVRALPLFLDVDGRVVVHAGLHPSGDLSRTTRAMALYLRRWPYDGTREDRPFWWQVYKGDAPVVFGHDAARGHTRVDRDGMPLLVGLDTGCVYGGKLTGWVPDQDKLIQVPARKAYAD